MVRNQQMDGHRNRPALGRGRMRRLGLLALLALLLGAPPAAAAELVVAVQFGIGYLPLYVLMREPFLAEHARAEGLAPPALRLLHMSGMPPIMDGLIAGQIQIGTGGTTAMVVAWDRTRGHLGVKGVAALARFPNDLLTTDPKVRSVKDFGPDDRIAVAAVRVSVPAVLLEMAAEQAFGPGEFRRLDAQTVPLSQPDGLAALLSRGVTAQITNPPFSDLALADPRVHKVWSGDDILGGPATALTLWTTTAFHDGNPALYRAFLAALEDAQRFVKQAPQRAAEIYGAEEPGVMPPDRIEALIAAPGNQWSPVPERVLPLAQFLRHAGTVKSAPERWSDLFFPEIADRDGS